MNPFPSNSQFPNFHLQTLSELKAGSLLRLPRLNGGAFRVPHHKDGHFTPVPALRSIPLLQSEVQLPRIPGERWSQDIRNQAVGLPLEATELLDECKILLTVNQQPVLSKKRGRYERFFAWGPRQQL